MKDFLSDVITSLSGKRQTRIYDILAAARVAKSDLDSLAKKLSDTRKEAPIVINPEGYGTNIDAAKFDGTYRDVYRRVLELFQKSNDISLILDTQSSTLISEIKAIEDELLAMEKAVDNYAFTLSDNGFYDYAFTETFNDDTMMEKDIAIKLTDRSGVDFRQDEVAAVNGSSGILTLNPALTFSYPLVGHVFSNNCLGLMTSDTGLDNSLNASVSNGWRVALASPRPISSSLDGIDKQGAQIELELLLTSAAPCDTIVLTPFSDIAIEILRIQVINGSEDANITDVLTTATVLDRPLTFSFPLQSVAKFRIVINQSIYSRGETPAVKEQVVYRDFYTSVKKEREDVAVFMNRDYNKNEKAFKRIFINSFKKDNKAYSVFKAEIPRIDFDIQHGPMTIDKMVRRQSDYRNNNNLEYKSKINTFMRKMIDDSIFPTNTQILNDRQVYNVTSTFQGAPTLQNMNSGSSEYPRVTGVEAPLNADILSYSTVEQEEYLYYQYNLGLRNIQIGVGEQLFRGVFITKQIPAPSGTGEIKLKSDTIDFQLFNTSRDMQTITSVEFSVSNKSTPSAEEDWIPVQPIDVNSIQAERLFISDAGVGYMRFAADPLNNFAVYKNGYRVELSSMRKITNTDNNAIRGVQLPIGTFTGTDIFLIDYVPFGDQQVINFESKGFSQSLLASAYDDLGAGETFYSTANNQIVTLMNNPYVSYDSVNANGSYSSTLGFTGSYQPITIVLSDGTIALNQTNYLGNTQNNLSEFDETKTAYIHSNNNIIFNKPIDSRFTVYYQYIPSNLRLRIVLRVNDVNYVSPVVNSVQIKAKTLKANARKAV